MEEVREIEEPGEELMEDVEGSNEELIHNKYKLERLLGEGGFARTWLATDVSLDRLVALKVLKHALVQNTDSAGRFEREARLLAKYGSHPSIPEIYETSELERDEGVHAFMAMQFVEGVTLEDWMEGGVDLDTALKICHDVAVVLDYLHSKGVWHRDLKPANIMLEGASDSDPGKVVLIDFGLGQAEADKNSFVTSQGLTFVGTPAYAPPHESRKQPGVDLYPLGITLFEMIEGRVPFLEDSAGATFWAHYEKAVPPMMKLRESGDHRATRIEEFVGMLLSKKSETYPLNASRASQMLLDTMRAVPTGPITPITEPKPSSTMRGVPGFLALVLATATIAYFAIPAPPPPIKPPAQPEAPIAKPTPKALVEEPPGKAPATVAPNVAPDAAPDTPAPVAPVPKATTEPKIVKKASKSPKKKTKPRRTPKVEALDFHDEPRTGKTPKVEALDFHD